MVVVVVIVSALEFDGLSCALLASYSTDRFGIVRMLGCTCGEVDGGT